MTEPQASPSGESVHDEESEARVVCVCCGWTGPEFAPFGVSQRRNARCPGCDSVERHRLLYQYLRSRTDLFTDRRVRLLHFGPERSLGRLFRAAPNIEHVTSDLHDPNVMIRMDITDILFRDDVFDVVICNHVLEHVPDDMAAMREVRRVLKPSGFAILQVPIYDQEETFEDLSIVSEDERRRVFGQRDHVRRYGRDFGARLERAGFHVTVEHYPEEFSAAERRRYRFAPADIYVLRKGTP